MKNIKNGKTRTKSNGVEMGVIIDAIESAQRQINKIPFSVFESSINTVANFQTSATKSLIEIVNSIDYGFIQEMSKIIQRQTEILKTFNDSFLYINRPETYRIAIPEKIDKKTKEIKELKNKIEVLKEEVEKYKAKENSSSLKVNSYGIFSYKGKNLKVSADSNSGKLLKYIIEDKDHFVPDEYCQQNFNCQTSKEITYITRDLNKVYLSKDGLNIKLRRCRDSKGYILEGIKEIKS